MAETKLIPGFRFHPTDVELVLYYLKRKVLGQGFPFDVIAEIDIYKYAPWDLPDMSLLNTGDLEWYFFCPVGRKYSTGGRLNRATETGYWKTTGKDRSVEHRKQVVGMIRTLVFHTGKPPRGDRTDWVMHEFRLEDRDLADRGIQQDTYVICRVFRKEGPGPRNGAQYGKPFDEKDWDSEEEIDPVQYVPVADMAAPVPILPSASHISVASDMLVSAGLMPSSLTLPPAPSNQVDDDILSLLDMFTGDDNAWAEYQNHGIEVDNPGEANNAEGALDLDPNEIFVDLGELDRMAGDLGDPDRLVELDEGHGGQRNEDIPNEMLPTGDLSDPEGDFLELNDLEVPLPPWFFW